MSVSGSVKMGKQSAPCNLSDSGSTKSTRKFRFLSWSSETYSLTEFVNSFPLPRVVRVTNCDDTNLIKSLLLPNDVDITQPLLLYKKYRAVKVQAKCLKASKSGKWKDVGVSIVIPDSFPGWFSLLTQDGKECAMMLTSMGQVAAARVPAFLTKFDVPVYKLTENEPGGNKSVYVRTTMKAGSVLRLLGVWADFSGSGSRNFNSYSSSHQNFSKGAQFLGGSLGGFGGRLVARSLSHAPQPHPQQQQPPQVQYVQCLSHENEPIFIPFWATGVFYPVGPRGGRNPQHIYPLSAIARSCPGKVPLRAKMVCGNLPNNIPEFSGALQIESVDTEDVILACTLLKDKPSMFEIDIESELLLSQMTSEDLFIKSTGYQSALMYCRTEGDNWKRQIKECGGGRGAGGGTVSSSYLLKKSLRIRSSPPPPSKLSLLFRPSSAPFGKDNLRRSKSFNVEVQSVSLSLTHDEEDEEKKLSTLFNFMNKGNHAKRKEKQLAQQQHQQQQQQQQLLLSRHNHNHHNHNHQSSVPDVLSNYKHSSSCSINNKNHHNHNNLHHRPHNNNNNSGSNNNNNNNHSSDIYGRVLDDVTEEENIYAEISDALTMKLSMNPIHQMGMNFHRLPIPRHQSASNMSSLLKSGGGSDGAFSGTLSGTFSSSNPSNREEDIYDSVF